MAFFSSLLLAAATPAFSVEDKSAQLDTLATRQDYTALTAQITGINSAEEFHAVLDWLGQEWQGGSSVLIAFHYAGLLQQTARQLPGDEGEQLRGSALSVLLYAAAVSMVDGKQCGDASAPENRFQQAVEFIRAGQLNTLSPELREQAARIAVTMEQRTWAKRSAAGDAKILCTGGMQEISHNLAAGAPVREVEAKEGQIGRQMVIENDGKYVPTVIPAEQWLPKAEVARADVPSIVRTLAGLTAK